MLTNQQHGAMPLYRALYQSEHNPNHIRGMTFAAPDAYSATQTAEDWTLRGEILLTVKPVASKHPIETIPTKGQLALI